MNCAARKTPKIHLTSALFIIGLLFSLPASSTAKEEQKLYTVEMMIIKHLQQTNEETWPNNIELKYPTDNLVFLNDGLAPIPAGKNALKVSNKNDQKNSDLHRRLKSSRDFRVLYHQSWVQHIKDKASAENIVIQTGRPIDGVYPVAGSIKLYKGRYLHLQSNLWFVDFPKDVHSLETAPYSAFAQPTEEHAIESAITAPIEGIWPIPPTPLKATDKANQLWTADIQRISQIQQHRRMRSNEIHYIDHPLYGIILEIRPFK
ncbi:MAG: hypothetical protein HRU20_21705 [Pseudomonadales bacterium]|nr:hypothetical protein [Pseudomonadales bacterium]